ncbi:MAG: thioesterase family protein [Actinomycetota bacterium]|nr:thioesterase family protein [Actinomycetota bacterium]
MDAGAFLGMEPAKRPLCWRLEVTASLSTGGGFLFGGCGLAAAIVALEAATGRNLVWATAQYLSYARPPAVLTVEVTPVVEGRSVTQARAVGRVGEVEVFTVNAALGHRSFEADGSWAERPEVAPPAQAPARQLADRHDNTIMSRVEMRLADARQMDELDGSPGSGRSAVWARVPGLSTSAAGLGVLGDWVPFGIGQALGGRVGGNSLDNTLRVVRLVPTDWVLLDIRIQGVANGFGHGLVHLWAEDGTLLATASQSAIMRAWSEAPPGPSGAGEK